MNRGKDKRIKRATRLNLIADKILAPVLRKQGKLFQIIVKNWSNIAGQAAEWALPLAVHFPDGDKTDSASAHSSSNNAGIAVLSIGTTSARAPELQMLSAKIIERANNQVGYMAFGRIRINQSISNTTQDRATLTNTSKPASRPQPAPQPKWYMDDAEKAELEAMISTIKDDQLRQKLTAMLMLRLMDAKIP
ncbi:MAG: DUF721 domain-containing protein [Alphaproteobacteria bacterium]|nr:DUF721 domain-containing protein [Alphaproteobacteria bacterium]